MPPLVLGSLSVQTRRPHQAQAEQSSSSNTRALTPLLLVRRFAALRDLRATVPDTVDVPAPAEERRLCILPARLVDALARLRREIQRHLPPRRALQRGAEGVLQYGADRLEELGHLGEAARGLLRRHRLRLPAADQVRRARRAVAGGGLLHGAEPHHQLPPRGAPGLLRDEVLEDDLPAQRRGSRRGRAAGAGWPHARIRRGTGCGPGPPRARRRPLRARLRQTQSPRTSCPPRS